MSHRALRPLDEGRWEEECEAGQGRGVAVRLLGGLFPHGSRGLGRCWRAGVVNLEAVARRGERRQYESVRGADGVCKRVEMRSAKLKRWW